MTVLLRVADENIISLLGLQKLPDQEKAELLNVVAGVIQKRVVGALLDKLGKEGGTEFAEALLRQDAERVAHFATKNKIDIFKLTELEIGKLKSELVTRAEKFN